MKVNMDLNPTKWRKKNRIIQIRLTYCDIKPALNVSVLITFIRTLISEELFTLQRMLVKITGANKMYTTKRYKRAFSVLNLKVLSTWLSRGTIFENVGFFLRNKKNPPVFHRKMLRKVSFHIYRTFWLVGWFIGFSISTQFNGQKHFYFKLFKQLYVTIQLSVNTVLI